MKMKDNNLITEHNVDKVFACFKKVKKQVYEIGLLPKECSLVLKTMVQET